MTLAVRVVAADIAVILRWATAETGAADLITDAHGADVEVAEPAPQPATAA